MGQYYKAWHLCDWDFRRRGEKCDAEKIMAKYGKKHKPTDLGGKGFNEFQTEICWKHKLQCLGFQYIDI